MVAGRITPVSGMYLHILCAGKQDPSALASTLSQHKQALLHAFPNICNQANTPYHDFMDFKLVFSLTLATLLTCCYKDAPLSGT